MSGLANSSIPFRLLLLLSGLLLIPNKLLSQQKDPQQNLRNCLNGYAPCDSSLLDSGQLAHVREAAHKRNVFNCKQGYVPCNLAELTPAELQEVRIAEYRRNAQNCKAGYRPCDLTLLESPPPEVSQPSVPSVRSQVDSSGRITFTNENAAPPVPPVQQSLPNPSTPSTVPPPKIPQPTHPAKKRNRDPILDAINGTTSTPVSPVTKPPGPSQSAQQPVPQASSDSGGTIVTVIFLLIAAYFLLFRLLVPTIRSVVERGRQRGYFFGETGKRAKLVENPAKAVDPPGTIP